MKRNRFTSFMLSLAVSLSMTTMLNANISANAYTGDDSGILYGDVNSDGAIDARDMLRIKQYVLGVTDDIDTDSADCFADGTIDARDALRIKEYILQMVDDIYIDGSNTTEITDADFTFDIEDKEIYLDELQSRGTDDYGDFIVPVEVLVTNNTAYNIDAFQLALDTDLGLYSNYGGDFANIGADGDTYNTDAMDVATATKRLLYTDANGKSEKDGVAFTLYVTIPADASAGEYYPIEFSSEYNNACYDRNGNVIKLTGQLLGGYVKVVSLWDEPATTTVTTTDTEETTTTEDCSTYIFDVNQDGYVNVVDLLVLKKRLLGMI